MNQAALCNFSYTLGRVTKELEILEDLEARGLLVGVPYLVVRMANLRETVVRLEEEIAALW